MKNPNYYLMHSQYRNAWLTVYRSPNTARELEAYFNKEVAKYGYSHCEYWTFVRVDKPMALYFQTYQERCIEVDGDPVIPVSDFPVFIPQPPALKIVNG